MVKTATATPLREERRETIMAVAREVFFEHGYSGTSMSAIAARLGGSKGTLYNYFKSKEELFEAYVRRHCAWQQEAIMAEFLTPGEDVRTVLLKLGRNLLNVVLSEVGMRNFVLVISEAHRAPEIGLTMVRARIGNQGDRFNVGSVVYNGSVSGAVTLQGQAAAGVARSVDRGGTASRPISR